MVTVNDRLYNETLADIGKKLTELRKNKGYTSSETFALDNDLPRVQYWRIEKGKANLTFKSLSGILQIHNFNDHILTIKTDRNLKKGKKVFISIANPG